MGPNCHIGSPVLTPAGRVISAVNVAVNGAGPEVALALIVTEQCGVEGDGPTGVGTGCVAAITTKRTTSSATAITPRKR